MVVWYKNLSLEWAAGMAVAGLVLSHGYGFFDMEALKIAMRTRLIEHERPNANKNEEQRGAQGSSL
jgi:hypothetical protein